MSKSHDKLIIRNFRKPEGAMGHKVAGYMATENFELNTWAIELLDIQKNDHILEIGFGPGLAIRDMAAIANEGYIAGLDYSELMVQQARRLNKEAVNRGQVELFHGDVSSLPSFETAFDKVISVNNIMYWKEPIKALAGLQEVIKPGGIISLVFQRHDDMFRKGECRSEIDLYQHYLREAGYCHIQVAAHPLTIKRQGQKKQIIAGISVRGYNKLILPATTNEFDLAELLNNTGVNLEVGAKSLILNHNQPLKLSNE